MSANRRAADAAVGQAAAVSVIEVVEGVAVTELPGVRERAERVVVETGLVETGVNPIVSDVPRAPESSDICVSPRHETEAEDARAAAATVTLFVYGWHQVQPGALSWVFPSVRAALDAVRTMRNAMEWCICSGESWEDIESARASGAVLIEQLG